MGIKKINEWEKAVVFLLNLDGWELEHGVVMVIQDMMQKVKHQKEWIAL